MSKMKFIGVMLVFVIGIFMFDNRPNINNVSLKHLDKNVKGVGYKKAKIIIAERDKNGHFKDWDDFKYRIRDTGVGHKTIQNIKYRYNI